MLRTVVFIVYFFNFPKNLIALFTTVCAIKV